MSGLFTLLIFIFCYQIQNLPLVSSSSSNTLNGQHLQVIWVIWLVSWTRSKSIDYFYLASLEWKSPRTYGSAHGWRHRRCLGRTFQFHVSEKHFDLLSHNFPNQFSISYEMVRVTENRLEPLGKERGLFNYMWEQVASSKCWWLNWILILHFFFFFSEMWLADHRRGTDVRTFFSCGRDDTSGLWTLSISHTSRKWHFQYQRRHQTIPMAG